MTDHAEALRAALDAYLPISKRDNWLDCRETHWLLGKVEAHLPAVLAVLDAVTAERDELLRRVVEERDHTTKAGFSAQATEGLR